MALLCLVQKSVHVFYDRLGKLARLAPIVLASLQGLAGGGGAGVSPTGSPTGPVVMSRRQ